MTSIDIIKVGTKDVIRMSDIPITDGSKAVASLMESDYIELSFVSSEPTFFDIGDYVDLADRRYDDLHLFPTLRKRYVVKDKQVPTYSASNDVYEYKLRLDAYYWMWNNRVFKYRPALFGQEASWSLTGSVRGFMDIFVDNLKAYGFGDYQVEIEQGYDHNIYVSFDGTLMIDALNSIITAINEAYKTHAEWWVTGNTIHIGDCNIGSPVTVTDEGDDKNAISIMPKDAESEYSNRLIIFGGTQNLSPRYRKELWFQATTVSGNVIYDDIHKKFSPSWFKKNEREYPESERLHFTTQMRDDRYWLEDYQTVGSLDANTSSTHVISTRSFNAAEQTIEYNVNFSMVIAAKMEVDGNGNPDMASIKNPLSWNTVDVTLRAVCVDDPDEKPIILATKEFKATYNQNVQDASDKLNMSGTWTGLNSSFVGKSWRFELVCDGRINREDGIASDVIFTSDGHTAVYALSYCTISFLSTSTYRIRTTILMKDGRTANCIINNDFNDVFTDEAKRILVSGISVSQNEKFTFPTIVKGRVDAGYFNAKESDGNVNSIVQKNLMLPVSYRIRYNADGSLSVTNEGGNGVKLYDNKNYIDAKIDIAGNNELTGDKIVERIVVFDEIFPRMKDARIDKVGWYKAKTKEESSSSQTIIDEDGDVVKEHIFYQFVDNDFPFTEDCILDGVPLKVTFQDGLLSGMTFEVGFPPNRCPNGLSEDDVRFEIIANTDYGIELPNDLAYPKPGDKYILSGWDVEAMEGTGNLIAQAEAELLEEGVKLVTKTVHDPHTYDVVLLSDQMYDAGKTFDPCVGCAVFLKNGYLFPSDESNQRELRVIGYEVKLDKNYDTAHITIGESKEYSRLKALERTQGKSEQSLTVYAGNIGGGGGSASQEWDSIRNKPVNIAGYGIVDAYIRNGIITLGTKSIRPLTENDYEIIQKIAGSGFFEKVTLEDGKTAVRLKPEYAGLYSSGFLSAYGINPGGGGGGSAVNLSPNAWTKEEDFADNLALASNLGWGLYDAMNTVAVSLADFDERLKAMGIAIENAGEKLTFPVTGSGNAVTNIVKSGTTVTITKGATFLTGNQTITLSGDVTGSGTTSISATIGNGVVTNAKLANSSITINGTATSLGGSFRTATITAGTAGTSSATSGYTLAVPYLTMNAYGIVTGYGTHTHTVNNIPNSSLQNSSMSLWGNTVSLGGSTNGSITINNGSKSVTLSVDSNGYLQVNSGFYSTSFISAYGVGSAATALPTTGGTLTGNLRLKNSTNYGLKLNFGDDDYVYLYEDQDDKLTIFADKGLILKTNNSSDTNNNYIWLEEISYYHSSWSNKSSTGDEDDVITIGNRVHIGHTWRGNQSSWQMYVDTDGKSVKGAALFNGWVKVAGTLDQGSDIRMKNVIDDISLNVQQIADAPCFRFTYKDDAREDIHIGSSAQYWKSILPNTVKEDGEGWLSLNYIAVNYAAVVALAKQSESHEERIKRLEAENEELRNKIVELERA